MKLGFALVSTLLGVAVVAAGGPAIQSRDASLFVDGVVGGVCVHDTGHDGDCFELPAEAHLEQVVSIDGGWLALGTLAENGRRTALLVEQVAGRRFVLPELPGADSFQQGNPRAIVQDGRLAGVVWLEGTSRLDLAVRAAAWLEDGWGPVETPGPPGPESQVALESVTLDDGSWLAVWSRYVEPDDDTVWSRRTEGEWSLPKPIADDDAPDVTPDVAALTGGRAVVAWSAFDGSDYRLRIARFDGRSWQPLGTFGGRGGVDPQLLRLDDRMFVLFKVVEPPSWSVLELGPDGRPVRAGSATDHSYVRPRLESGRNAEELRLRWQPHPFRTEGEPEATLDLEALE